MDVEKQAAALEQKRKAVDSAAPALTPAPAANASASASSPAAVAVVEPVSGAARAERLREWLASNNKLLDVREAGVCCPFEFVVPLALGLCLMLLR
jgi:hypothetical protein